MLFCVMFVVLRSILNFYRTNLWDIICGILINPSVYRLPRMGCSYWKHTWLSTFCAELNFFLQKLHEKLDGVALPVDVDAVTVESESARLFEWWSSRCVSYDFLYENDAGQNSHLNCFSPLWWLWMCPFSWLLDSNSSEQKVQTKLLSVDSPTPASLWLSWFWRTCRTKCPLYSNR